MLESYSFSGKSLAEDKKQHYCGDLVLGWGISQNTVFNH